MRSIETRTTRLPRLRIPMRVSRFRTLTWICQSGRMGRMRIAISMKALCSWRQIYSWGEETGKTYKSGRNESKNSTVHAFGCRMCSWVEDSIQRHTLEDIEKPCHDRKDGIESHGAVDQVSEGSSCGEPEVEKQEGHFDDPVHPDVIYFLSKKSLAKN